MREIGSTKMAESNLCKIEFYVPETHLEAVKNAMFETGAGKVGAYDSCAWQTLGHGQFRPKKSSDPYIGTKGSVETVSEFKVEMVCEGAVLSKVILALKESHPYEEVAYSVIQLWSGD